MILSLLKKELLLEFRQKAALGGILVYVAGAIFISAICFKTRLDKPSWNALFWVIILFTSVTVSGKSFQKESGGQALFNYLHYNPSAFILSKIVYNTLFMLGLNLITFFFYGFFLGNEVDNPSLFAIVLLLASGGFAGILSLMSAIASKAGGNFALMSILSFPVLLPMIMVVIRLSKQAVDGIEWAGVSKDLILVLISLNVLTAALSWMLFPYLWKE